MPLRHAAPSHHSFLTRCIGLRKNNRTDHLILYLNMVMNTGSESIEAVKIWEADTVRRICGAHGGHETTKVCDVGELVGGTGCVRGQEK